MIAGSLQEDIAKGLSDAVIKSTGESGPTVLAQSYDIFVRETEGGKQVVDKLSVYTAIPMLAAGFFLGWVLKGSKK